MVTSESINSNIHDVIAINSNIFKYCILKILFIVTSMMMSSIVLFIATNVSILGASIKARFSDSSSKFLGEASLHAVGFKSSW